MKNIDGIKYYIGLDIGTDSVGYAVTDENYTPLKKFGEPMLGVQTFDPANTAADRRAFRTSRRRIDRRQQRVELVNEIFAPEVCKIDPNFFIRRKASRLHRDEAGEEYSVFNDVGYTDKEYNKQYPTIHHLIVDLMNSKEPHDVRLVYIACAWLVAHRGHFLFDVSSERASELLDFNIVYQRFCEFFSENGYSLPWDESVTAEDICGIMKAELGVTRKKEGFKAKIYSGKKIPKQKDEEFPFGREALCALLCGAKIKPEDLFQTGEYEDVESIDLKMDDENFARIISELGDDSELLLRMRAMQDCALLLSASHGCAYISEAKADVYEQHKKDLKDLKKLIRKYTDKYNEVFRENGKTNYTAYSYNMNSKEKPVDKKINQTDFCDYIKKILKNITPDACDEAIYADIISRLETGTFMPKQRTGDNRVIPQQLYRVELKRILDRASEYLVWLNDVDNTGLSARDKLLSIFDYRIPYFVGPLAGSEHSWIVRKADDKIYPWNFKDIVDLDACEEAFITRMTNNCTYLAGESVLPKKSLLYARFSVLNEINNLKIDDREIPVEVKQEIFNELMCKKARVTPKTIRDYLVSSGKVSKNAVLSGIGEKLNASLYSYHKFKRLLENGVLTETEVENIISRAAYSEDKARFIKWLAEHYPQLSSEDRRYIIGLDLKKFGTLSKMLLSGIIGADRETGEAFTIIEALWTTNNNLMQLLSDKFTFREEIERFNREYYAEHPQKLSDRLSQMYISNSVKRPILRTLDICEDVVKAVGCAPTKIFVEMARDVKGDKKGKRTDTRKEQLQKLYKDIKTTEARELEKELEAMGELADNKLQGDKLFLYYMQMGRCAYSGKRIELSQLSSGSYNIDHIYPQAFVKDDSIINNKVLVGSEINGGKSDVYPISSEIRAAMQPLWSEWKKQKLISDEKYKRLTRSTPFTEEERWGFINRQLVETRQSTKAVAELLKERYPESSIVYVKAGLVSEYRQEFGLLKSRAVNDLHHAKDAYLNIVVGNVYDSSFTRKWFSPNRDYSIKVKTLFSKPVCCGGITVWQGSRDIERVKRIVRKNHVHLTRYAFMRKGGLFDQMPLKADTGLVPLKKELPSEKYGGYNKPAASFYYLVKYRDGKKHDVMLAPVELMHAEHCLRDRSYAENYIRSEVGRIVGRELSETEILLDARPIKINTELEADGLRMIIKGKAGGGKQVIIGIMNPLLISAEQEQYVKRLEAFQAKQGDNASIIPDEEHDGISRKNNTELYSVLADKLKNAYRLMPGNQAETITKGKDKFEKLDIKKQVTVLLSIISLFGSAQTADLSPIGGAPKAGVKLMSSKLSNWAKTVDGLYIIDSSSSGIFERRSENLLSYLENK